MINLPIWACIIMLIGAAGAGGGIGALLGHCCKAAETRKPPPHICATGEHGRFGMRDNTARCGQCVREKDAPGWERQDK